ncbi:MAG TPA: flagellar basal body protein FliL [Gammaproteobacteria bacterium]|nr:flagellar basal body protein FliL [Gammaproteobacteria bacterium]
MADDDDNEKDGEKKSKGSLVTKILLFGVLPLLTVVVLVMGTLFFAGVLPGGGDHGGDHAEESADAGDEGDGGDEEGDAEEEGGGEAMPAIYIPIDPAFVVNFASQGKARFLQVTVEVMTRDPEMPDKIKLHMPVIRNNLMLLFSSQSYDGVSTLEGKEALREEALEVVQQILEEETGDPGVEAVYFTSFVMQ